jgi:hypothetical protein
LVLIREEGKMSSEAKSFARRDRLVSIEHQMQTVWEEEKVFQVDAGEVSKPNQPSSQNTHQLNTFITEVLRKPLLSTYEWDDDDC